MKDGEKRIDMKPIKDQSSWSTLIDGSNSILILKAHYD